MSEVSSLHSTLSADSLLVQGTYLRVEKYFKYFASFAYTQNVSYAFGDDRLGSSSFMNMILHCFGENVQSFFSDFLSIWAHDECLVSTFKWSDTR